MTLATRLFTEAERREAEARAERLRRIARHNGDHRIAPQSVASALWMLAGLLWFGIVFMADAGLLAVL